MTILRMGKSGTLTHLACGLRGVSVPSGCPAGAERAVELCRARPTASGGEPHPAVREAWPPPLQVFQLALAHVHPPTPTKDGFLLLFVCEGRAGCREAGPVVGGPLGPAGLSPWRPSPGLGRDA